MIRVLRNRLEWADLADQSWRAATPAVLAVPAIALMALPLHVPLQPWAPQLGLLCVIFWSTQKPQWMPALAAMALGLLQDLWMGSPLGLMMLINGLVALLLSAQLVYFLSRPFLTVWAVVGIVIALAGALMWAISCAAAGQWLPVAGFLVQAVLTMAMAPIMFYGLSICLARLLDREPVVRL
jgi:rod shape-determining protein MreD